MGKTRDLCKKIWDLREHFMQNGHTTKDRYGKGLTEVEDIKKRWQGYTEELYKKKVLMTQISTMAWSLT